MKINESHIFSYLITNKDFRDWVLNPTDERSCFWEKWIDENPEAKSEVKKAREFIERLSFKKDQLSFEEQDELLGKIIANEKPDFRSNAYKQKGVFQLLIGWIKVAAILAVCFISFSLIKSLIPKDTVKSTPVSAWRTVKNAKGKRSKITLPDGTVVMLNSESQLKFPLVFDKDYRRVQLIGEAFFEVVHNDTLPFIVQTYGIETEVLGTTFNVKSLVNDLTTEISLVSGKVKVNKTGDLSHHESISLAPGEQADYNRNSQKIAKGSFDMESTIGWKEGVIYFKDTGLEEFISRMESWYGVDFQVYGSTSKKWKINGRYENEKLDNILTGLKFVYGIDYIINGKNITLKLK